MPTVPEWDAITVDVPRRSQNGFRPGRLCRQPANEADADIVQTSPATDNEELLFHQSEPRCQGPQAAGAEDRPLQEGLAGKCLTSPASTTNLHLDVRIMTTELTSLLPKVWFQNARAKWRRNNLRNHDPSAPLVTQPPTTLPQSPGEISSFSEASPLSTSNPLDFAGQPQQQQAMVATVETSFQELF